VITRAQRRDRDLICHRRDCYRTGKAFDKLLLRVIVLVAVALALMQWAQWLPGA
jgi:hypothetical protein